MDVISLLAIAVALAMDAFAVSAAVGIGLDRIRARHVLRLSMSFGFFQFMMLVIGWFAGSAVRDVMSAYDHWIALGLLAAIGLKMIYEAIRGEESRRPSDPTGAATLLLLSIATSIDSLAVGVSFSFLKQGIWLPAVVVGVVAAVFTATGLFLGRKAGAWLGAWAEAFGGVVLIGIGVSIVLRETL